MEKALRYLDAENAENAEIVSLHILEFYHDHDLSSHGLLANDAVTGVECFQQMSLHVSAILQPWQLQLSTGEFPRRRRHFQLGCS